MKILYFVLATANLIFGVLYATGVAEMTVFVAVMNSIIIALAFLTAGINSTHKAISKSE